MNVHDQPRYSALHDEEIVGLARHGDFMAAETLVTRYRSLVELKASAYFVCGAERADVVQEGMIGLCKAIQDFDITRLPSFRSFAELCVTRQILTAVKAYSRRKHEPLNNSYPLNPLFLAEDFCEVVDSSDFARRAMLSGIEGRALECYMNGDSYREIATVLQCTEKAVDNALQRAKRKMAALLRS
ncbi:MAG: sigma-70 family RNA polymerase sigma factor [Chthonomonas sp.]|nr:sigma-70 family RNA polymerase sigma factor [Chthonomonas sp.]